MRGWGQTALLLFLLFSCQKIYAAGDSLRYYCSTVLLSK